MADQPEPAREEEEADSPERREDEDARYPAHEDPECVVEPDADAP